MKTPHSKSQGEKIKERTRERARLAPDDPEQAKRFVEMAREIGAAETEEEAERALKAVLRPKARAS